MEILFQKGLSQFLIRNNKKVFLVNLKNKMITTAKNRPDDIQVYLKSGYWYRPMPTEQDKKEIEKLIEEAEKNGS